MQYEDSPYEILFVTHKYPPSVGGMQRQSYELIHNLTPYVKTHRISYNQKYPKLLFMLFAGPWAFIKILRNPKIRIVHANDGLMALCITPLLYLTNRKLAATIHGLDIVFRLTIYQAWVKKYLSKFDLVIAVSEATLRECQRRGVKPEKSIFIANGFEPPEKFVEGADAYIPELKERSEGKLILTSIGRPIPRKGFLWFINQVLPHIKHEVLYVIVGPRDKSEGIVTFLARVLSEKQFLRVSHFFGLGTEALLLDKVLNKKENQDSIFHAGKLSNMQLNSLLRKTDLYIMPNLVIKGDYEGFGLVALEAISQGVLCLAADADGISSAVKDGINGIMLPQGEPKAWADKINELAARPQQIKLLSKEYTHALMTDRHDWKSMSKAYHEAFLNILNDN